VEVQELQAACFNGVTFKGWRDTFTFEASGSPEVVSKALADFFRKRGAEPAGVEPLLLFKRGRRFWRYFSFGPELWADHEIVADVQSKDHSTSSVTVSYQVPGWWIRARPYQTEREVGALMAELRAT
jgi:hypothetical protein